jgi:hypothetical protein
MMSVSPMCHESLRDSLFPRRHLASTTPIGPGIERIGYKPGKRLIAVDLVKAEPKNPTTWILLAHAVRHNSRAAPL